MHLHPATMAQMKLPGKLVWLMDVARPCKLSVRKLELLLTLLTKQEAS